MAFTRLKEFLGLAAIQALGGSLAATLHRDGFLTTKARQNNADLLFRRIVLAGFAVDGCDQTVSQSFIGSTSLIHLHSLTVTMNQKFS